MATAPFSLDQWQVQHLRLTVFPVVPFDPRQRTWWKDVTGDEPESSNWRAREQVLQEDGSVDDARLAVNTQANRMDLFLAANITSKTDLPLNVLGSYLSAKTMFMRYANRCLDISPKISRIALGGEFYGFVPSLKAGNEAMGNLLPAVQIDAEQTPDFVYQINRLRASRIEPQIKINRVTTWSLTQLILQRLTLTGGTPDAFTESQSQLACRLVIDFNTATDSKSFAGFESPTLHSLFEELNSLLEESLTKGDVA